MIEGLDTAAFMSYMDKRKYPLYFREGCMYFFREKVNMSVADILQTDDFTRILENIVGTRYNSRKGSFKRYRQYFLVAHDFLQKEAAA